MTCHARTAEDEPESTIPFPWVAIPKPSRPRLLLRKLPSLPRRPPAPAVLQPASPVQPRRPPEKTPIPRRRRSPATAAFLPRHRHLRPRKSRRNSSEDRFGTVKFPEPASPIPSTMRIFPVSQSFPFPNRPAPLLSKAWLSTSAMAKKQPADGPLTVQVPVCVPGPSRSAFSTVDQPDQRSRKPPYPLKISPFPTATLHPRHRIAPCLRSPPPAQWKSSTSRAISSSGDSTEMSVAVDDTPATIVAAKPGVVFWDVPEVHFGPACTM